MAVSPNSRMIAIAKFARRTCRTWYYPVLGSMAALSISAGSPEVALSVPWAELFQQGAQVVQLYRISDRDEVELGKQINQQLLSTQFQPVRDRALNDKVNRIGQKLAQTSSRPDIPYTFQVVKDKSINAFATAGGFVYVTTGLLEAVDNEAQLAGVLAHEIGHIAARHTVEQMRQTAIAQGLANAAGVDRNKVIALGVELGVRRPRSRQAEFEADRLGFENMQRAGYDRNQMIAFLEKLRNQSSIPAFLSTHPATSDRIARLQGDDDD
ncbi:M48 family metalloprotease [Chroococcidiopsidales cyanobacterium LEGE 13417]|nr:M48 family metalloprotease [Chroococcidiopsidales cyanobacterium LEGE 13417]